MGSGKKFARRKRQRASRRPRTVNRASDYAQGVLEAVQVPLAVLDVKTQFLIFANESFYKVFGASPADIPGKSFDDLGLAQLTILLAKNARFQNVEFEREFPLLGLRTLSVSARPIRFRTRTPDILVAIEDITERKEIKKEREAHLMQTQRVKAAEVAANQSKDFFLATLSHELRTPLTALLMQAQLLRRGELDNEKIKKIGDVIERAARRQARLVNDLLDVSRMITGRLTIDFQAVDLAPVIRATLESISSLAEAKHIRIETELDPSLGPVSGDPLRLRQVIWNLLNNAIKFTPETGAISLSLKAAHGQAQIQVKDSGEGIEAQFLPHLFDRFTLAGNLSTRVHGGLGLGLAIVRQLVEVHGGHISAESPGKTKGATFTVTLPIISRAP